MSFAQISLSPNWMAVPSIAVALVGALALTAYLRRMAQTPYSVSDGMIAILRGGLIAIGALGFCSLVADNLTLPTLPELGLGLASGFGVLCGILVLAWFLSSADESLGNSWERLCYVIRGTKEEPSRFTYIWLLAGTPTVGTIVAFSLASQARPLG